jgi:chemotaxis protein methyltransferase CheR
MEVTSDQMVRFKDLVYSRSHLTFSRSREPQLRRWIVQRATEGKYRSFDEYYQSLCSDTREFEQLLALITTRETYFFRMPDQFDVLKDVVLPEIVEREGRLSLQALSRKEPYRMRLHVWSAGCATGQETYSLSMQLLETLRYAKAWDIKVLGTDINPEVLETARAGYYEVTRLESMPARIIERYCRRPSPHQILLEDEVKAITEFQVMNLRNLGEQESFKNAFDIIFCRNVMIYFDLPAQQQLITALSACLKQGGYLFTGEGEVLHLFRHELEMTDKNGCIFYRRPNATC